MKNLSLVLSVVSIIGVIVMLMIQLNSKSCKNSNSSINTKRDTSLAYSGNIAFVNTDSLLIKYDYYNVLKDKLIARQKQLEGEFAGKQSKFEQEAMAFQKKVQNNSFLSLESAQAQEAEIYRKQQELLVLKDDLSMKLMKEEQEMTAQLYDSVVNLIKVFNADNHYSYIINNNMGNALLFGDESTNLTDTLAAMLNERYKKVANVK